MIPLGLFVALVITRIVWIESFYIPSGAMIPTLQVGDHIFVNKLRRKPARGDVVVFVYPKDESKDFVKRVVAVGGDTVAMQGGRLTVNGKEVTRTENQGPCEYRDYDESTHAWTTTKCRSFTEELDGKRYTTYSDADGPAHDFAAQTVPDGGYFVMGDNRDHSSDSRYWGSVPADHVKGTFMRVWRHHPKEP